MKRSICIGNRGPKRDRGGAILSRPQRKERFKKNGVKYLYKKLNRIQNRNAKKALKMYMQALYPSEITNLFKSALYLGHPILLLKSPAFLFLLIY